MQQELLKIDHRQLSELYSFWLNHCDNDKIPSRTDFDVVELSPWLGHLMIIQPVNEHTDFLYKLHGTHLVDIVGEDLTGQFLSNLVEVDRRDHLIMQYHRVCKSHSPEYKNSNNPFEKNYKTIKKLILPLARDGETVDELIVGVYGEVNWLTRGNPNLVNSFTPSASF